MTTNYDPTDIRGQEIGKQEADARKRAIRKTEIADVKWLMSSPRGRRVMWRLLATAGVFRLSYDPVAMKMAFNEGNRNLGLNLLNEVMELCPEMFPVMEKEQRDLKEQQQDGKRDGNGDNQPNN